MKQRRRLLAAVLALGLGLVFVGLGARHDDPVEPSRATCTADLGAVFDWCAPSARHFPCKYVDEEYADACQAGCVMALCPEQAACTGLDAMWCAPCTDEHGAKYWLNASNSLKQCESVDPKLGATAFDACRKSYMKQQCPAWNGHWPKQTESGLVQ